MYSLNPGLFLRRIVGVEIIHRSNVTHIFCFIQPETASIAIGRIYVELFVQCLNSAFDRK